MPAYSFVLRAAGPFKRDGVEGLAVAVEALVERGVVTVCVFVYECRRALIGSHESGEVVAQHGESPPSGAGRQGPSQHDDV